METVNLIVRRLFRGILTIVLTVIIVFTLIRSVPGDPAVIMAGSDATPEQIEQIRVSWGLNESKPKQFWIYVKGLLQGNMGYSFQYITTSVRSVKVIDLIMERLPRTLLLAAMTVVFSVLVAVPLGVITALKPGSAFDNFVTTVSLAITSFPNFFVGMVMITVFALKLGWLPTGGYGSFKAMILPTIALSLRFIASLQRVTRTEVGMVLNSDYIMTAQSKGLSHPVVLFRHALRNVLIPVITLIGMRMGGLITGAVYVETLFRYNGIGMLMINAVNARDFPTIQALVPYAACVFILINIVIDVLYSIADPRVRVK
ncbi:MAG: ABC transporter permease [Puniceicoccales bacterium]|nr:ABC transporter permease [Puniceicoccales bacterium]